jgi:hypothetical protein
MLNANAYGQTTKLAADMTASQTTMRVAPGAGATLDPGAGNHVWLTLRSGGAMERVKVIGRSGDILTLEGRGGDGTSARQWPASTCISVEWNPAQLCEFTQNCVAGAAAPTGVEPQTVCMGSCTCFDVASDGRITRISGGRSC